MEREMKREGREKGRERAMEGYRDKRERDMRESERER